MSHHLEPSREPKVAVLGYHKIGAREDGRTSWFYIPEDVFERQLRGVRDRGWQVIDVDRFLAALTSPGSLTQHSVLVTFDDGYRSMRHGALPILRSLGLPAVLFVPSAFVGGSNHFDAGIEPEEAICDWDDLLELQRHGVSVQSHGVTHRRFSTLDHDEL